MRKKSLAMVTVALMGFASGLPLYLTGFTLKAWLTEAGLDLRAIGLFGLVTQPYALKFLWAPVLDRFLPPFLGRRRGWMVLFQGALCLLLVLMALADPRVSVSRLALLGLMVAFASASQDIVVDAWRREAFAERDLGLANAVHIGAYRVAMLASGAGALVLAQAAGWRATYLAMAGLMAVGALGTFLAWSTDARIQPPKTLREAVTAPLAQLLKRPAIAEILAFCLLYKIGDQLADAMSAPFLLRGMGFTKLQIGATTKTVGMVSIILGGILGGLLMKKLSLKRALLLFGFCQAASILAFWALSHLGPRLAVLTVALALENLSFGMGGTAFATFIMLLCDRRFTATQYALLSSLLAITRGYLTAPAGWFALRFGWSGYFLACAIVAIPGLLLLARFDRWGIVEEDPRVKA
ncbi:AmpG family muropeptide MFS transporter [Mesoterricola silvestris]|uniref:AmpG family muropeptide MFS transporter n=1 Tax=Mesoterricola silvestris TaxID=2927979 RepID=A0AA48GMI3_9BACT|nr:MFS transporter [Mesoterricola silvestris]BDU72235.1 AmpG family muropeptide MFS transporter [Mesoterricola silvestris]